MLAQKKSAEQLGIDISTRFYAIMEDLAHDPRVSGVRYHRHNLDTKEKVEMHPQQVVGVMSAIFIKYQQMGDWSPMTRLQDELRKEQELNARLENKIAAMTQDRPSVAPLDPDDS